MCMTVLCSNVYICVNKVALGHIFNIYQKYLLSNSFFSSNYDVLEISDNVNVNIVEYKEMHYTCE